MPINRVWHSFAREVIKVLPDKAGVYELGDAKGEVVYIGSSNTSVRGRLLKHKERTRFMHVKCFRFQRADPFFDEPRKLERKHCELFRKRHNGTLPRLQERSPSKPWTL